MARALRTSSPAPVRDAGRSDLVAGGISYRTREFCDVLHVTLCDGRVEFFKQIDALHSHKYRSGRVARPTGPCATYAIDVAHCLQI